MVAHLAVCIEPYLSKILSGEKKVELRFAKTKRAPYYKVKIGDIVYLKKSGGKILGYFVVDKVIDYKFRDADECAAILRLHAKDACLTKKWMELKRESKYASAIFIKDVKRFKEPIEIEKKDQLAWVVDFSLHVKSSIRLPFFKSKVQS